MLTFVEISDMANKTALFKGVVFNLSFSFDVSALIRISIVSIGILFKSIKISRQLFSFRIKSRNDHREIEVR